MALQLRARAAHGRARLTRVAHRVRLGATARHAPPPARALDCRVFAFSSRAHLPEQVASLRSLLAYAGRPRSFTVVSDGTHDARARAVLHAVSPCVRVVELGEVVRGDLPAAVRRYAASDPNGAKLALELSLPVDGPVVYADADVLFFPGARALGDLLAEGGVGGGVGTPYFLRDCEPYLDRRLVSPAEAALPPVNGGFLVLFGGLAWEPAIERLDGLGAPVFHTEQTLLHLAVHGAGGRPLDPRRYVVATDDMRRWRDDHAHPGLVLRHYTTPVRHKLWNTLGMRPAGTG